ARHEVPVLRGHAGPPPRCLPRDLALGAGRARRRAVQAGTGRVDAGARVRRRRTLLRAALRGGAAVPAGEAAMTVATRTSNKRRNDLIRRIVISVLLAFAVGLLVYAVNLHHDPAPPIFTNE